MAKLRKGVAYRNLERPYARKSRYKNKNYVNAAPNLKVVRFDMGELKREFPVKLLLLSKENLQIRHNAIESARQTSNRILEKELGKTGYHFKIRIYPHHVLRENPLASGAGADRMSTGMKMSFGKPIGLAAQVKKDQVLMEIGVNEAAVDVAKKALIGARHRLPCDCRIIMEKKPRVE